MANKVFKARYAKHPTSAISGVTHFSIGGSTTVVADPGSAGTTGEKERLLTHRHLTVTLYGQDLLALLALVGATKANLVLGYQAATGANRKKTIKNVFFHQVPQALEVGPKDGGGKPATCAVQGVALWLETDTYALMVVDASDT